MTMKTAWFTTIAALGCALQLAAATDGTVNFTVRTINFNTSYDPRNILAIWVVDGSGNFVKTLKKCAATREGYLYKWIADSNRNTVDAITSATLSNHQTHNVAWNCRNTSGVVVPDGVYRIRVEYTMQNGQGPFTTNYCEFVKGTTGYTTNYPDLNNRFTLLALTYTPIIATHDVTARTIMPTWAPPDSSVPFYVSVSNKGSVTESFVVRLSNTTAGTQIGAQSVLDLAAGAGTTVSFNWNTTGVSLGTYLFSALAGPVVGETFTIDNLVTTNVTVRYERDDVAVHELQCAMLITPGAIVPVKAIVTNSGDNTTGTTVTLQDETDGVTIGSQAVASLAAGTAAERTFNWNTAGRSLGYHSLLAYVDPVAGETSLADNSNRLGVAIANGVVTNTTVAPSGEWRYHDQGLNLHASPWNALSYYDNMWPSGAAPLGYGGDGQVTILDYGPDATNKYPTYYFRREFSAAAPPLAATLRVRRDDGVVLYINGVEVARDNMPAGPPAYSTYASGTVGGADETTYFVYPVADPTMIRRGRNVLAAEVHQAAPDSSDLGFDAQLDMLVPNVPAVHDIALLDFASYGGVAVGDRAMLSMAVANNGSVSESFSIDIADANTALSLGSASVASLAPGEETTAMFQWDTLGQTAGTYELEATAGPVGGEANTSDNSQSLMLGVSGADFISPALSATGAIGGFCAAAVANGSTLFLAEGASLTAVDVTTPSSPIVRGRVQLPGTIRALDQYNGWVYAACGAQGVCIVDAAVPEAMRYVSRLNTSGGALDLEYAGSRLYVADGPAGLRIVDVADPNAPELIGAYHSPGPARAVAVSGSTVYLLDGHNGLLILNAANPAAPALSGQCNLIALGTAMQVAGGYAYVVDGEGILSIVNLSTTSLVSRTYLPAPAQSIALAGATALVPAGGAGVVAVDTSAPAAPVITNTYTSSGEATGIALAGATAYLADGFMGLAVLDVSSPAAPALLGTLSSGSRVRGSAVTNGLLYVAAGSEGVRIYDIANAALPLLVGTYGAASNALDVAVDGGILCVADGQFGLSLASLATPAAPAYQGTYLGSSLGAVRQVITRGSDALISDGYRVEQVDISAPAFPSLMSSFTSNMFIHDLALGASNLYLATGANGVQVLTCTSLGGLAYDGAVAVPDGSALGVAVSGARLYVADEGGRWHLFDTANPSAPSLLKSKAMHLPVHDVVTAGPRLHALDAHQGLHSFDVSLRLTPIERTAIEPLARALRLAAAGRFVYVAQDDAGAAVLDSAPDDSDFDGLPDSVELAIINADPNDGIVDLGDVNPNDDFDGDLLSNFAETVAGTDPTDPMSVFAVRRADVADDGTLLIRWSSVADHSYAIYRSAAADGSFLPIATGIEATPPLNVYTNTVAGSNVYYTVVIE